MPHSPIGRSQLHLKSHVAIAVPGGPPGQVSGAGHHGARAVHEVGRDQLVGPGAEAVGVGQVAEPVEEGVGPDLHPGAGRDVPGARWNHESSGT